MSKTKDNKYQAIFMNIHWYLLVSTVIFLGVFSLAGSSEAATHYVSPAGSATWAQSMNIDTPTSISTAMANAQAGDTVYFRGGTYSVTDGITSDHGTYEPAHSGTSDTNRIIFMAYPGETPTISMNCTATGNNSLNPPAVCYVCQALGVNGKSYITWDGFTLTTSNNTTAGINVSGLSMSSKSVGVIIQNMTIISGTQTSNNRDNCDIVRINTTSNLTIKNNKIQGLGTVASVSNGGSDNTSAIKLYHNEYVTIENNEIYNQKGASTAISAKSDLDDSIIRYNYIHDCDRFIFVAGYNSGDYYSSDRNKIYHNVLTTLSSNDSLSAISCYHQGSSHANDWEVYNNTVYIPNADIVLGHGGGAGFSLAYNLKFHDNIIYMPNDGNSGHFGQFNTGSGSTISEEDHNCYYGNRLGLNIRVYGGTYYTDINTWQNSTELIGGNHPGSYGGNTATDKWANPLFANGSGNYAQLSDFTLQPDSPCKGTGRDGVDMGADISLVGLNTITPSCGDGSCNGGETCSNCSSDCGTCIDTTPPAISNGSPNGTMASGTTQTTMSVSTNENATCRWSSASGTAYSSMLNTFSTTGGTSHSTTITGLSNGQTYNRYIRCQDAAGNPNTSDYVITFSVGSSQGTTINLYPTQDTYIDLNTETNISNTTLNTYTWPANQIANAILMKFNLSSIPFNATIQNATLNLYLTEADINAGYPAYTNTLHRIINHNPNLSLATGYTYDGTNPWTANTLCYNNIPMAQSDISSAYDTQQINKTLGFKSWNAAQLIKDWLSNPSANYGLLINSDATKPADTYRTYASSEHTTTSYRPYLDITYTLSEDTTPPAAPTGLQVN